MNPISIKLSDDNFLAWKTEALRALRESNFEKFITLTDFGGRPKVFLEKSENNQVSGKISQEYRKWEEQDQVVYRWLLASISPMLRIKRAACTHSFEVWNQIEIYFSTEEDGEEQRKINKILDDENSKLAEKTDKENKAIKKEVEELQDEKFMLEERLKSLVDECLKLRKENEALEEEVVEKHGPESIADVLKMKPDSC